MRIYVRLAPTLGAPDAFGKLVLAQLTRVFSIGVCLGLREGLGEIRRGLDEGAYLVRESKMALAALLVLPDNALGIEAIEMPGHCRCVPDPKFAAEGILSERPIEEQLDDPEAIAMAEG
jgi:hypothetical protein